MMRPLLYPLLLSFVISASCSALADIKFAPLLGKQLDRYREIDPRYAPHPSGGNTADFARNYALAASRGEHWRVISDCASACTMGFGFFPRSRICIGNWVKLGFHLGENERATAQMWNAYPADIKILINSRGGMRREWLWIDAAEFHKLGYSSC